MLVILRERPFVLPLDIYLPYHTPLSRVEMLHTYRRGYFYAFHKFSSSPSMHQRRPYYRGGTYPSSLPASYRNKALLIVGVTVFYTAWLHQKGGFLVLLFADIDLWLCFYLDQGVLFRLAQVVHLASSISFVFLTVLSSIIIFITLKHHRNSM